MTAKRKEPTKNLLLLFLIIPVIVGAIAVFKGLTPNKKPYYVKIKVSQGFWWVSTAKPKIWLAKALEKGHVEYNLLGQPVSEVIKISYYPSFTEIHPYEDSYEIYLSLKILADFNERANKAIFKRSTLSVGTPIELDFPSAQITGTVIELSEKPFNEVYEERVVYLTKRFALPWEYDAIQIGDKYFDGNQIVFEVLDKNRANTPGVSSDVYGNLFTTNVEPTRYITVKAKILLKNDNGQLILGEERVVSEGSHLPIITNHFRFVDFVISKINKY